MATISALLCAPQSKRDLEALAALLPSVRIILSHLLQRQTWRGVSRPEAAERARKRINSAVCVKVLELGGLVISHPDINFKAEALCRADGVHPSDLGNDVWLDAVATKLGSWLGL